MPGVRRGAAFPACQPGSGAAAKVTSSGPPGLSHLLPASAPSTVDAKRDHDQDANEPYTTSLQQRQQQAADFYRTQHSHSRASSSSGSAAYTLRRTPNFEHPPSRARSLSNDSATPPPPPRLVRFADNPQLSFRARASSQLQDPGRSSPHPALRISRRTASAIRFVLEEGLRVPHSFTPDLTEENASMADLTAGGSGRAANGGARTTTGPIPVQDRSNIRTPQMIMNQRREREARRQEADAAQAAEEQRKTEEERRRSAERRAQAAGVAGAPQPTGLGAQRQPQGQPLRSDDGYMGSYPVGIPRQPESRMPTTGGPVNPPISTQPTDTAAGAQQGRPRASSQSQPRTRPAPSQQPDLGVSGESRRPPPAPHARRPSATAGPSQAGPSTAPPPPPLPPGGVPGAQQRQSTTSTFPHAFERWETLSSHWEGLTSYWIRRLEENTDPARPQPLTQQLSRQITDLSAAGANLFHAVVELQRLRASSERKFQRWFYEHRQEQERAQEREAQLEQALKIEREARVSSEANTERMERMATDKNNAERAVQEMKRELQISKEEARRAWEELGRREQEERDRTFSLREGQPTLVGGVQVVPMAQGMGRHGSVSQRPHEGEESYGAGSSGGQYLTYGGDQSPTDTDPFTETAGHSTSIRRTYIPSGASALPSATRPTGTSQPPEQPPVQLIQPTTTNAQQPAFQPTTSNPEAFYQQPDAYLHRDSVTSNPDDERSYVTSHDEVTSEGDEEFAIDEYGNYMLDAAGHRIPFRALRERDSDDEDVQEDRRRELEHLQHYGTAAAGPSNYATTSSAGPSQPQTHPTSGLPDYSGAGYGDQWAGMRHHHPTRLSDVMEEDERSRTSPSRASQASRGRY
ncbi:hypothetical protein BDV95DRAFT_630946 [Massariosphaeria phaeospora]|uniref:Uncharacterized protein n=1 Tax=Massariosphaeria phaeospora TaxID=100035 RepID=A0A7C8M7K3_9PLEO|nr:hypothetical protein BDV95DRAFT_630946 [Massariosphaeria phaeospora]